MPPKDYDEGSQQIIIREIIKESNGGFSKFKDAVFFALVLGAGATLWSMSYRLAKIETVITIMAEKSGIRFP